MERLTVKDLRLTSVRKGLPVTKNDRYLTKKELIKQLKRQSDGGNTKPVYLADDVIAEIMIKADPETLARMCSTNKYYRNMCMTNKMVKDKLRDIFVEEFESLYDETADEMGYYVEDDEEIDGEVELNVIRNLEDMGFDIELFNHVIGVYDWEYLR